MAVSLNPQTRYRRTMAVYLRDSGVSEEVLAERLGISPGTLASHLSAEIVPDPTTFLRLRSALQVPWHEPHGLDHDYVQILARAQTKPHKRTSKIQDRHVIPTGMPDPLAAESAEELVEKLREVHWWALKPSLRELEKRTGKALKRSTISDMLHPDNKALPRFDRYAYFLEACGVQDLTYWVAAWRKFVPPNYQQGQLMAELTYDRLRRANAS